MVLPLSWGLTLSIKASEMITVSAYHWILGTRVAQFTDYRLAHRFYRMIRHCDGIAVAWIMVNGKTAEEYHN